MNYKPMNHDPKQVLKERPNWKWVASIIGDPNAGLLQRIGYHQKIPVEEHRDCLIALRIQKDRWSVFIINNGLVNNSHRKN